jgi:hypothetical protein
MASMHLQCRLRRLSARGYAFSVIRKRYLFIIVTVKTIGIFPDTITTVPAVASMSVEELPVQRRKPIAREN